jgi:pimeloyl-ACP methyl ester carboxylesterase
MFRPAFALLFCLAAFLLSFSPAHADRNDRKFYQTGPAEFAGPPGSVIRLKKMLLTPDGAMAYKVLYVSTGLRGEHVPVSATVVIPLGDAPPGGRPIVAWAHPTTGVMPRCAPSLSGKPFKFIEGLAAMVNNGYVVVSTDYPGLGTPQPHPYMVGLSEAYAVIDSVRAAHAIDKARAGTRFVVWGAGQGGQAALFTGMIARTYAPDLTLLGVAAAAPATDLAALMQNDIDTTGGSSLVALGLWSWSRVYGAPLYTVVQPGAMAIINKVADTCLTAPRDLSDRKLSKAAPKSQILSVPNLTTLPPWKTLLAQNTPARLPRSVPVFLLQGSADQIVPPPLTTRYANSLCAGGSRVLMQNMIGVSHGKIAHAGVAAAMNWIMARFAGIPAPTSCRN